MATRVLLIRAVNVGGAKLPMAELRQILEELGGADARTYIASGNAIVELEGNAKAFDRAVEAAIKERYGYFREVISRSPVEIEQALAAHPFEVIEPKYSYITFLTSDPSDQALAQAESIAAGSDEWKVIDRELHIRFANGAGKAELNLDALLRKLRVAGTARNLNTVQALIDLAG